MQHEWDVVIVGGGPAGLSAALLLGRARRRVLVLDSGRYRNAAAPRMHGFLSRDGTPPDALRATARDQLSAYANVELRRAVVADAAHEENGFRLRTAEGEAMTCRKLLLATGLEDALPDIPGLAELYGTGVWHCPYCDGWERQGQPLGLYGRGERLRRMALELLGWTDDLVLFSAGACGLDPASRSRFERLGIVIREEPIEALEGEGGELVAVRLKGGERVARSGLFIAVPARQRSNLAVRLGAKQQSRGIIETSRYERTDVPGLYVAGDASRNVQLAIVAAAEGAMAAFAINSELLKEDLMRRERGRRR